MWHVLQTLNNFESPENLIAFAENFLSERCSEHLQHSDKVRFKICRKNAWNRQLAILVEEILICANVDLRHVGESDRVQGALPLVPASTGLAWASQSTQTRASANSSDANPHCRSDESRLYQLRLQRLFSIRIFRFQRFSDFEHMFHSEDIPQKRPKMCLFSLST